MRTGNPILKEETFAGSRTGAEAMSLQGAVNKTVS